MSFSYTFTIHNASPILHQTAIADTIPNCAEMVFISAPFSDYGQCFNEVTLLFNKVSGMVSSPQPAALILHKLNPRLNNDADGQLNGIDWSPDTVCKLFLADAQALKKGTLTFSINADVKYDGDLDDLLTMFQPEQQVEEA